MPSARGNWCEVGAATRVAKYREWIADSIEYLEGKPLEAEDERMERDEASQISAFIHVIVVAWQAKQSQKQNLTFDFNLRTSK